MKSLESFDLFPLGGPLMPSSLAQETTMDDSRQTTGCRRMRSGLDEDVRVASRLRKGHRVYAFHSEFRWKTPDDGNRHLMSPWFPCSIVKASREEWGRARAVQDAQSYQT